MCDDCTSRIGATRDCAVTCHHNVMRLIVINRHRCSGAGVKGGGTSPKCAISRSDASGGVALSGNSSTSNRLVDRDGILARIDTAIDLVRIGLSCEKPDDGISESYSYDTPIMHSSTHRHGIYPTRMGGYSEPGSDHRHGNVTETVAPRIATSSNAAASATTCSSQELKRGCPDLGSSVEHVPPRYPTKERSFEMRLNTSRQTASCHVISGDFTMSENSARKLVTEDPSVDHSPACPTLEGNIGLRLHYAGTALDVGGQHADTNHLRSPHGALTPKATRSIPALVGPSCRTRSWGSE